MRQERKPFTTQTIPTTFYCLRDCNLNFSNLFQIYVAFSSFNLQTSTRLHKKCINCFNYNGLYSKIYIVSYINVTPPPNRRRQLSHWFCQFTPSRILSIVAFFSFILIIQWFKIFKKFNCLSTFNWFDIGFDLVTLLTKPCCTLDLAC